MSPVRGFRMPGARMQDEHLTYIGALSTGPTRYDVYHRDARGPQLGWVERWGKTWWGMDLESGVEKRGPTRWEVAVSLWPPTDRRAA